MKTKLIVMSLLTFTAMTAQAEDLDGKKIYDGACFACHNTGVANSPKLGDKDAWKARIEAGKEALYATAINGKGAMPPKGGRADLSDDQIKVAVDYMIEQSQ